MSSVNDLKVAFRSLTRTKGLVLTRDRLNTLVFGVFAAVALSIALVGVAGVLAFRSARGAANSVSDWRSDRNPGISCAASSPKAS
jgi:hypothetical protein